MCVCVQSLDIARPDGLCKVIIADESLRPGAVQ